MAMIDGDLRRLFRKHLPQFHWVSVETGGTGRGIPDSEFCCDGVTGWIEFKRTSGWTAALSPEQIGWHMRRARAGGKSFIAVRRKCASGPRRGDAVDEIWLYPGADAIKLKNWGMQYTPPLLRDNATPARWDWERILAILLAR